MQLGQPIPALGQDVVMDVMDDGNGAMGGAAGKKFFPKKFGGVCKITFSFVKKPPSFPVGWLTFFLLLQPK